MIKLFICVLFFIFAQCQLSPGDPDYERKFIIDPFTEVTPTMLLSTGYTDLYDDDGEVPNDDIFLVRSVQGNSIFGGDRDMILHVTAGQSNLLLTSGVSAGSFSVSTPNEARGRCEYILDGGGDDDDSYGVDPLGIPNTGEAPINFSGLAGLPDRNFELGNAEAIRVDITSDLPTFLIFNFYSNTPQNICQFIVNLGEFDDDTAPFYNHVPDDDNDDEGDANFATIFLEYQPRGSCTQQNPCNVPTIYPNHDVEATQTECNWQDITAIFITASMVDNRDVILRDFSTWGPVETCECFCPTFTCQLLFDNDDDEFTYYFTSQLGGGGGVFNPTTDFSTVYQPASRTSSPRPPGVSATPAPSVTVDDDDDFFLFFFDDDDDAQPSRTPRPRNNNDGSESSGAASLAVFGILSTIIVALF